MAPDAHLVSFAHVRHVQLDAGKARLVAKKWPGPYRGDRHVPGARVVPGPSLARVGGRLIARSREYDHVSFGGIMARFDSGGAS
jgi:hypothetical protein